MSTNKPENVALSPEGQVNVDRLDRAAGGDRVFLDHDYKIQSGVTLPAESRVQVVSEGGSLWLFVWLPNDSVASMKFLL